MGRETMRRLVLLVLALFVAGPAFAIDTNIYPDTLVDQACTDDFDVPAAPSTIGPVEIAGGVTYPAQTSGSSDGSCDNDPRIVTGAITADTRFGPFTLATGSGCVIMHMDVSAISAGNFIFNPEFKIPHDGTFQEVDLTGDRSGTGEHKFVYGHGDGATIFNAAMAGPMPLSLYLFLDLTTATTITTNVSLVSGCPQG